MTQFHKMKLFDIHTHNTGTEEDLSIISCEDYIIGKEISIGIHPWHIDDNWKKQFCTIKKNASKENVRAIGECGIDKAKSTSGIEVQKEVFKAHAYLAEETRKPLIIHCVKGMDEIIAIRKEIMPKQPWIIHGFRGKPQQAEQFINTGLYISFGEKFNIESIKNIPTERLFIESDDCRISIHEIYKRIAETRCCSVTELATAIMKNAETCNLLP